MSIAITALTQVSNLLVTLNSSVNFIIYIIYGEKFQRLFLLIFCQRHQRQDQMLHRRFTTSTYQATAANPGSQSHNGLYSSRTRPTRSRARVGQLLSIGNFPPQYSYCVFRRPPQWKKPKI